MAVKVVKRRAARRASKPRKASRRVVRKRRAKRVTKKMQTGSFIKVWRGTSKYTKGGLTKNDLCLNKKGRVVSKKARSHGMKVLSGWTRATKTAYKQLGLKGFVPCKKGTQYYRLAKE